MTEHADTVVLEDEFLAAAREIVEITALEKQLAERKAAAKQIIEKALAVGEQGVSPDGEPLVAVRAGASRFDPDKATQVLPSNLLESIMVTAPDAKRAKAVLAPGLYELCVSHNKSSVVVL